MLLEQFQQHRQEVDPTPLHLDEPRLVVEPGGDHVHFIAVQRGILGNHALLFGPHLNAAGDLPVRALHAVAQAHRLYAAVLIAGPGVHRHGVRVIDKQRPRLGHFADILAKIEQCGDGALCVHDAARADGIAHALVHAILQGDIYVELEGLQPTLTDHRDHVVAAIHCRSPVERGSELRARIDRGDITLAQLCHHIQVALGNIRKSKFGVRELGYSQNIAHQPPRESNRPSANHGYFYRHIFLLKG